PQTQSPGIGRGFLLRLVKQPPFRSWPLADMLSRFCDASEGKDGAIGRPSFLIASDDEARSVVTGSSIRRRRNGHGCTLRWRRDLAANPAGREVATSKALGKI